MILFYFLIHSLCSFSQLNKDIQLINGKKHLGKNFNKYKIGFSFDSRNTFVASKSAKLGGMKLGLYINRIHCIGLGIYGLNKPISASEVPNVSATIYSSKVSFSYLSLFYERILYFNKKWEWSSAIHFGAGQLEIRYKINQGEPYKRLPSIQTRPLEISTSVYHHLNYWVSLGAGIGYRYMRKTPQIYRPYFNGAIYLVKLKIRLFKLIKSIGNKEVKNEY